MLLIMGFGVLVRKVCIAFGHAECGLAQQFRHVAWDGLHLEDTIFPLFLFIAGVSFAFSCARRLQGGATRASIAVNVLRRAVLLFVIGLVYNGMLKKGPADTVWMSVLGRIGLAWALAALIRLYLPLRGRMAVAFVILLAYWMFMRFVGAPDHPGAFPLSPEGNFSGYLDRLLLPGRLTVPGLYSNQGLLSTLPAVVTALLGIFAGDYLRSSSDTGGRKAATLAIAAAILAAAGLLVAFGCGPYSMPLNKILWSTSFVLVVGGYSTALLALFYWIIDVKGCSGWTTFFRVIGMNAIAIYVAQAVISFSAISNFFLGWAAGFCSEAWAAVVLQAGYVAACWLFLWFLDRRGIYLKV